MEPEEAVLEDTALLIDVTDAGLRSLTIDGSVAGSRGSDWRPNRWSCGECWRTAIVAFSGGLERAVDDARNGRLERTAIVALSGGLERAA